MGAAVDEDGQRQTPPAVIASVAAGVGPLPFLAVYSVLFIAHGFFFPVQPPDITGSRRGEAVAGVVAVALFVIAIVSLWWFLDRRRRWPFVAVQLATLATSIDFIVDASTGSPAVPALLVVTSAAALVFAFGPQAWRYLGQ